MDPTGDSTGAGAGVNQAYVWEPPEKRVSIEIDFDVVDRLGREIERSVSVGARRGVEIGGLLLGWAKPGDRLSVKIDDFEPVGCSYSSGPSYVLEGEDLERFERRLGEWRERKGRQLRAVGFYRVHTREGLTLAASDRRLLDRCFPEETGIALLIKPVAARAPQAALFFREDGAIRSSTSYREFPFRREELGGGRVSPAPKAGDRTNVTTNHLTSDAAHTNRGASGWDGGSSAGAGQTPPAGTNAPGRSSVPVRTLRLRGGWVWVPLSFIFLLLGTVLGFQVALSVQSKISPQVQGDPYTLGLTATPSADSVHLRWDRNSLPIQNAQRGVLVIRENDTEKTIELDAGHLRNGSVIYRKASNDLQFRLEVFMKQQVSISETVEYRSVATTSSSESR
jgi:hypothetical protein